MFQKVFVALLALLLLALTIASDTISSEASFFPSEAAFLFDEVTKEALGTTYQIAENVKYQGKWVVEEAKSHHVSDKKYITIPTKALHYGLLRTFESPLTVQNEELVVQYEVKYNAPLTCSGSYLKLLENEAVMKLSSPNDISDSTPYIIMFGPDKCGINDKVHFILRFKNPVSGVWNEHHLKNPPSIENDALTHIYTFVIRKDNSFDILIDGEIRSKGNLLEDLEPSIIPHQLIDDPTDIKPSDWVDEEFIDDPEATKPDDWDENQPEEIVDPEDTMPEGWLADEPLEIPDPEATMPEGWDVEEDGEWQAPLIPNPKCIVGCGRWIPRYINNPLYKGKWYPPKIKNPAFIGVWRPRQIPNPHYFEGAQPHNLPAMGALAFDIWTMDEGIGFGNILISKNEDDARNYIENVWKSHHTLEESTLPKPSKWKPITESIQTILSHKIGDIPTVLIFTCIGLCSLLVLICFVNFTKSRLGTSSTQTETKDSEDEKPEVKEDADVPQEEKTDGPNDSVVRKRKNKSKKTY